MRWINALSTRLLLASLLLLPLFCLSSGWMLDQAFSRSLLAAEKEKLKSQFYLLLSSADWQGNRLLLPDQLAEPRFSIPSSGLYARITDVRGKRLWQSRSSQLLQWPQLPSVELNPGEDFFSPFSTETDSYFYYHFDIAWVDDQERETPLRISLLQDQTGFNAARQQYQQLLWRWLSALSLILVLSLWLLMRWGLRPLRTLASELSEIQRGRRQRLPETYPDEIRPVIQNLNQLLDSERQQQARYRNTLGDLAHSLKTPLAVLRGFLPQLPEAELGRQIDEQIARMDGIVQHQLQRAVQRQPTSVISLRTPLLPVLQRLQRTLDKVYADKGVHCELHIDSNLNCHCNESDLLELCGNLLDNSYKYGRQQVRVSARGEGQWLWLQLEDDGKGVAENKRQLILRRGERADTATPGQGIGLAVVTDLLSNLGGSLEVDSSALGGACFRVCLPR